MNGKRKLYILEYLIGPIELYNAIMATMDSEDKQDLFEFIEEERGIDKKELVDSVGKEELLGEIVRAISVEECSDLADKISKTYKLDDYISINNGSN